MSLFGQDLSMLIVGYRCPAVSWDFGPVTPGVSFEKAADPENGTFTLTAADATRTLQIEAGAPTDSFAPVSIPTPQGWATGYGGESFSATITVTASEGETLADQRVFPCAALEFGGTAW